MFEVSNNRNREIKNSTTKGELQLGDSWNAITIIALSQNSPLKAIAEFVENSIDAKAKTINLIRGKEKGEIYLRIVDDGEGVPDLNYVATHIGDSLKRKLKKQGEGESLQGEFGIGLLSFWTVGENLKMTSKREGEKSHGRILTMKKGDPHFHIESTKKLISQKGTTLEIKPLLSGISQLTGEKIQSYLASELRDRIASTKVDIHIFDRTARKQYKVEPRKFKGRLLRNLPVIEHKMGEVECELYLGEPRQKTEVSIFKKGTRVISPITELEQFNRSPWNSPFLEGIIEVSFLNLSPGTRNGVIHDEVFNSFVESLKETEKQLFRVIKEQESAHRETASRNILKQITKAFQSAIEELPSEDYNWLKMKGKTEGRHTTKINIEEKGEDQVFRVESPETKSSSSELFKEVAGKLHSFEVKPNKGVVKEGDKKLLKVIPHDKKGVELTEKQCKVEWFCEEGSFTDIKGFQAIYLAENELKTVSIKVIVKDDENQYEKNITLTVTSDIVKLTPKGAIHGRKGLPGYTFKHATGQLWRSRFDEEHAIIAINSGHVDYLHVAKNERKKLRYVSKLFTKELALINFPDSTLEEKMEKMVEMQLYLEENL